MIDRIIVNLEIHWKKHLHNFNRNNNFLNDRIKSFQSYCSHSPAFLFSILFIMGLILFFISSGLSCSNGKTVYKTNNQNSTNIKIPPNSVAHVEYDSERSKLRLLYNGNILLEADLRIRAPEADYLPKDVGINVLIGNEFEGPGIGLFIEEIEKEKVEQNIRLNYKGARQGWHMLLSGHVIGSEQAFPAETRSKAQCRFPYIRNTSGLSKNLRNNAVYDRKWDWVLIGPGDGMTKIIPLKEDEKQNEFSVEIKGNSFELVFCPRYYQKHKNLQYFRPWAYDVWKESVTGWCSWWAYRDQFSQKDLEKVINILAENNMRDFGYRYIQIDDSYQRPQCTPESWLNWNEKWPDGMEGAVKYINDHGFDPGIWVHAHFRDDSTVHEHPDWFVPGENGEPLDVRYLKYGYDTTNPETIEQLIRPTFAGFKNAGFEYVKVDGVRHLIYDAYNQCLEYLRQKEWTSSHAVRKYIKTAREEMGRDRYILCCWGVMPEAIGLADGCRLGGDGYGWSTLQYYNSWNGVVWRNDPDHCDVLPNKKGEYLGGVNGEHKTRYVPVEGDIRDTIIRPALASFAGAVLLLSDRAEVYNKDEYLEGAKRSAPVLFTVPGQLYDYNPTVTQCFIEHERTEVKTGQGPRMFDAPRWEKTCPWWMLEIDRPFEHWNVLARFNWGEITLPATNVQFADLGLSIEDKYLVYEFWTKKFVGVFKNGFPVVETAPREVQMYAIRKKLNRPQIVSTNRHISQGGVDLVDVKWDENNLTLSGKSKVIKQDTYTITIFVPNEFKIVNAKMNNISTEIKLNGGIKTINIIPDKSEEIEWFISFTQ